MPSKGPARIRVEAPVEGVRNSNCMWVVVKIMVPLWIPIILRHLIFRVPKGTTILTTTHVQSRGWSKRRSRSKSWRRPAKASHAAYMQAAAAFFIAGCAHERGAGGCSQEAFDPIYHRSLAVRPKLQRCHSLLRYKLSIISVSKASVFQAGRDQPCSTRCNGRIRWAPVSNSRLVQS